MIALNNALLIRLLSYRFAKQLSYALIAFFALWILMNIIQTSAILFYHPSIQTSPLKTDNTNNSRSFMLHQIKNWHLFGQPPPSVVSEQAIPLSSLNLTLTGIFYQKKPQLSQVMLTDANGMTHFYKTNDHVTDDVILYAIHPDSVILERNGQLEKLTLPGRELQFAEPPEGLP